MASPSVMRYLGLMVLLLASHAFMITEAVLLKSSRDGKFSTVSSDSPTKVFVVYMGGVSPTTHLDAHISLLSNVLGSAEAAQASIIYSYTNSLNGFAAVLSDAQAGILRGMDDVVFVFPSKARQLQTSHSWEFLGLNPTQGLWPSSEFGNGTIIGLIDTGIWPESLSFNDDGFGPIPSTWKGECVKSRHFGPKYCNKKLIGGKFFSKAYEAAFGPILPPEYRSPRDDEGHGTHTSSTAAGRRVSNASFDGVCNGTISGGAPSARLAAYKACWGLGCFDADLLAAFDEAIKDGVHLISISIGDISLDYSDGISIGSYHAVEHGILVSASAGNDGPYPGSVFNDAPWIFTVAASTIDRKFIAPLQLGTSVSIEGVAINTFSLNQTSYPLAYGPDIAISNNSIGDANYCRGESIDKAKAKGKILLCQDDNVFNTTDESLLGSGAAGGIIVQLDESVQFALVVPSTHVTTVQGDQILKYITSTSSPTAFIGKSETVLNATPAPLTAYFSSVGPNVVTQEILKPDITAPGVDIIASWSPVGNPSGEPGDTRITNFNIISGTSMSCPHVAGAAALVKSVHPYWSPAAIKSALMTTATQFNATINQFNTSRELATGSGEINPTKAADPGLIYNLTTFDYLNFLCGLSGFTAQQIKAINGNITHSCPTVPPQTIDLNYPSIMLVGPNARVGKFDATTKRTLTNVGPASGTATYTVSIVNPDGVIVTVTPTTLTFADVNAEESFSVGITVDPTVLGFVFGSITWSDSNGHSVRIPVGYGPAT